MDFRMEGKLELGQGMKSSCIASRTQRGAVYYV